MKIKSYFLTKCVFRTSITINEIEGEMFSEKTQYLCRIYFYQNIDFQKHVIFALSKIKDLNIRKIKQKL